MYTKTTIALIGTGSTAKAVAEQLIKGNNRILLFYKIPHEAELIFNSSKSGNADADIEAVACSFEAAWEADLIIAAIPFSEMIELAIGIQHVAVQKIFLVFRSTEDTAEVFSKGAEQLQNIMPYTKVITAIHNSLPNGSFTYLLHGGSEKAVDHVVNLFAEAGINVVQEID